jgi:hypothetical protein
MWVRRRRGRGVVLAVKVGDAVLAGGDVAGTHAARQLLQEFQAEVVLRCHLWRNWKCCCCPCCSAAALSQKQRIFPSNPSECIWEKVPWQ